MIKHILVTGGAGYIGSAVAMRLACAGHRVTVFDDGSTGHPGLLPEGIESVLGDITDVPALESLFSQRSFTAVVHCAAKKAVGESEQDPSLYFHTNVTGSLTVLRMMEKYRVPQLIFSSTAAVYDPAAAAPLTEQAPIAPPNVYGQTKRMVEEMIQTYARLGKLPQYTIFRYFNVAGDAGLGFREEAAHNVFPLIARAARAARTFSIFGDDYDTQDGTGVRDYIHLADLVAAHECALASQVSGTFNLGTGTGYSVKELIAAFNQRLPQPLSVTIAPRRAGDPACLVADATKAREILGWIPQQTLSDMVESTITTYLTKSKE